MSRSDPIRKNYYNALERADKIGDLLFYIGATLSLASTFITKESHPKLYTAAMTAFALAVLAIFIIGLCVKLYLIPRAEDNRRRDFFSNAYGVSLIHEKTEGYYNNNQAEPMHRIAAQVLENSWFSKKITLRMLHTERFKIALYFAVWITLICLRDIDFGIILAISQAVFSEQIIAKYFRLEWLRIRCEETYERTRTLLTSGLSGDNFNASAIELFSFYETSKSNASIVLSSSIFTKINNELSMEWSRMRKDLNI